jgi:hypothetical protein
MLSNETSTFNGCQDDVCGPLNSTLVAIITPGINEFILNLSRDAGVTPFIGLYERGVNESNDWAWVNGSTATVGLSTSPHWAPGEPNNWCRDEDCVIIGPYGWYDAGCDLQNRCLCEYGNGNVTSKDYMENKPNLSVTTVDWCTRRISPTLGGIQACFWYGDTSFRTIFMLLGGPSLLAMLYVLGSSIGAGFGCRGNIAFAADTHDSISSSPYGQLLDLPEGSGNYVMLLCRLVEYGAFGEMLYGVMLLCLALMAMLHVNHYQFDFAFDAVVAIVMCVCKFLVAVSVVAVCRHLSPSAKMVAGPWAHLFAISKGAMGFCALALAAVNFFAFDVTQQRPEKLCMPGYIFCWSLLLSLVMQCMSGFAVHRIFQRAAGYAEDSRVIARVVGCGLQQSFVGCTFGVGIGLGLCSAFFVFDTPTDHFDPFYGIGTTYLAAAICQIVSGVTLVATNNRMKLHFENRSNDNARGVEMRPW